MNILIACEESQEITKRFRQKGARCFSCDILACSGGHPEWHIQDDCLPLLNGNCYFNTADGKAHFVDKWDLLIAHPPCTYLSIAGNKYFNVDVYGEKAKKRILERERAVEFFMQFTKSNCEHIAIENPVGFMNTRYRKPDQICQPWWFGSPNRKPLCLWLKNLPKLLKTNPVDPIVIENKTGNNSGSSPWHALTFGLPEAERRRIRSKTFPEVAEAIVNQWYDYLIKEK